MSGCEKSHPYGETAVDLAIEQSRARHPRSPCSSSPREDLKCRRKQARVRDPDRTLDNFDFTFNPKTNRSLIFDLTTGASINKREDALFLGRGGTGKNHLAKAIRQGRYSAA
jgi:DNA replication protein DnaC